MDRHILSHTWWNWTTTSSPSGKVYCIDWRMAQSDGPHIEGDGSPQMISLKSDISGNHVDNGEVGPSIRRKRRKKRDPRPDSIIVYRSEMEKSPGEDLGVEEGVERSTEEGDKFLCTPTGEGRTWEILFKACSDMPGLHFCVAQGLKCCFYTLYGKIFALPFVNFILNASLSFNRRLESSSRQPLRDPDRHHHTRKEEGPAGGHSPHDDRERTQGSG